MGLQPLVSDAVRAAARDGEMDRYLAGLLAAPAIRGDLVAIAAFAAEIERVPAAVREPVMGQMRLQWWRDALAAVARGETTGNPVADRLGSALTTHRLPVQLLIGVVDSREGDLAGDLVADEGALKGWLAKRGGALFELAWRVHGLPATTVADAACAEAGISYGLARALARLPRSLRHGGLPIPAASLAAAGLEPGDLDRPEAAQALAAVVESLARTALDALSRLRERLDQLPDGAPSALLPVAMVEPLLGLLRRPGHDVRTMIAEPTPLARIWRLWRASRTRRL